jgi:hypothetical protein
MAAARRAAEEEAEERSRQVLMEAESAGRRRRRERQECKLRAWRAWAEAVEQGLGYCDSDENGEEGGTEDEEEEGGWISSGGGSREKKGERARRRRDGNVKSNGTGYISYTEYDQRRDDDEEEESEQDEQRQRLQRHKWGLLWELAATHDIQRLLCASFRSWRRSADSLQLRRRARLFFAARGGALSPLCWRVFEDACRKGRGATGLDDGLAADECL